MDSSSLRPPPQDSNSSQIPPQISQPGSIETGIRSLADPKGVANIVFSYLIVQKEDLKHLGKQNQ